jgi:hypothetical protein
MKRVQLYLDDDLWDALYAHARKQRTSISNLLREAARDRYIGIWRSGGRMRAIVGIRKDVSESGDSTEQVRKLRRGKRLERLWKK